MSKRQILILIGVAVIVVPFLGFPGGIAKVLYVLCGLLIVGIAYSMAPKVKAVEPADAPFRDYHSPTGPSAASDKAPEQK